MGALSNCDYHGQYLGGFWAQILPVAISYPLCTFPAIPCALLSRERLCGMQLHKRTTRLGQLTLLFSCETQTYHGTTGTGQGNTGMRQGNTDSGH